MTHKKTIRLAIMIAMMALAMVLTTASAFAAGGPPAGKGHGKGGGQGGRGGGGGGGETSVTNNLSVPAILIGSGAPTLNFGCSMTPTDPTGTPLTGYPVDNAAYYYVQGIHKWQASCNNTAATATVDAAWGDNLVGGEASLRTNSPIRVEMGLLDTSAATLGMTGYRVDKLDPNALDRESAYGTPASGSATDSPPAAKDTPFVNPDTGLAEVRVWVAGAALTLTAPSGTTSTLAATAEINATGRIVYGYNLRVTTAGTYTLHFTVPSSITVNIANGKSVVTKNTDGTTTISLAITVAASSGGGGGGGGH